MAHGGHYNSLKALNPEVYNLYCQSVQGGSENSTMSPHHGVHMNSMVDHSGHMPGMMPDQNMTDHSNHQPTAQQPTSHHGANNKNFRNAEKTAMFKHQ
jgi:hypothetical protein